MNSLEALLILSSVEGCGVQQIRKLLGRFSAPEKVFDFQGADDLSRQAEIPPQLAAQILEARENISPGKIIDECRQKGISIRHVLDSEYPANLAQIYDPPIILYVKGCFIPEDKAAIGIVGSRRSTSYGIQTAMRFSSDLAEKGITIVSGLALGIDKAAHEGALRAKGRTVAVLGCGVDVIYPKENRKVYEAICEHGAVISEFPPGIEPRPFHFPKRNRVIAGLALGILVVEAGEKSGSLITARLGMDEGREIYAVPGRIDSPSSAGTHRLIQSGARLVTSPADILEDLYPVLKSAVSAEKSTAHKIQPEDVPDEEAEILSLIGGDSLSPEHLAEKSGLDVLRVLQILTQLELKGWVRREWGGMFAKLEVYFK